MEHLFFDCETTGLEPGKITQISYIKFSDNWQPILAKNIYFKIDDELSATVTELTGLTKSKLDILSGGFRFGNRQQEIESDFGNSILIGHNVSFDIKFLTTEFKRCGRILEFTDCECTKKMYNKLKKKGVVTSAALEKIVYQMGLSTDKVRKYCQALFGTDNIGFHDSRFDITSTVVIYMCYKEMLEGQSNWLNAFK